MRMDNELIEFREEVSLAVRTIPDEIAVLDPQRPITPDAKDGPVSTIIAVLKNTYHR
jgi:hypothetical protein